MGLDFSHCDAHWSYSGFNSFRRRLAKEIGVDLDSMRGFGGLRGGEYGTVPWDTVDDPIRPLLNHSDCDGGMPPADCRAVAARLRELVASWPEGDYDRVNALSLAGGMEAAYFAGEPLEFC